MKNDTYQLVVEQPAINQREVDWNIFGLEANSCGQDASLPMVCNVVCGGFFTGISAALVSGLTNSPTAGLLTCGLGSVAVLGGVPLIIALNPYDPCWYYDSN